MKSLKGFGILIIVLVILALNLFNSSQTQTDYEAILSRKDSILRVNNLVLDSLTTRIGILDIKIDSLDSARIEIKKEYVTIYKDRDEQNKIIDTAGVNYIRKYWNIEIARYDSIQR